ncbi:MAG TPA: MMPL family transporter, partial [Candidatus Thermoplasmatota archaeon]|nr:MMPL family transporter [Candidatus Thermoplasmatota archaeon]
MRRIDSSVADGLAAVSIFCSRHARLVLLLALLVTGGFAVGVGRITTDVDVADVLPRGNPNTVAAHELTEKFRSTFTQQVTLQLHIDEDGRHWRQDNAKLVHRNQGVPLFPPAAGGASGPGRPNPDPRNITDEVYVRAMEELVRFVQARTDFSRAITISNLYSLVNWTLAGGNGSGGGSPAPPGAFALPGHASREQAARYHLVDQAVKAAILDAVDAVASPSWTHAAALFMPAADNRKPTRELGDQMLRVRDEYVAAVASGQTQFTVFGPANPPLFTVDLPVANAHSSALVREDSLRLLPLVALFIVVCLFVAFRAPRAVAVSLATLVVALVWSYGTMGFLGIALNTLNMTIVPLVMGVGIDYSIHMINEFVAHKAEGRSDLEAFRLAGTRSGVAMLIATATTVGGLAVLIFSPSLLIADLGIVATVALSAIYLLAITFIPAALTVVGGSERMGASFSRSRAMPTLARGVTKARWAVLALLLAVSALAYPVAEGIGKEAFGDPGRNYLPSDPIRREHEKGLAWFYEAPDSDEKANVLTFSGKGILAPEAMAYYRTLEANLK